MWTKITRKKYGREGLRYASDTTDEEWMLIEPLLLLPAKKGRGRPRTTALRLVVDALFFMAQSGCQWRMLPKDFPPYTTVQRYFYPWRDSGLLRQINHVLVMEAREQRSYRPSAAPDPPKPAPHHFAAAPIAPKPVAAANPSPASDASV